MYCHLHRGDWSYHLTNETKKAIQIFLIPSLFVTLVEDRRLYHAHRWRLQPHCCTTPTDNRHLGVLWHWAAVDSGHSALILPACLLPMTGQSPHHTPVGRADLTLVSQTLAKTDGKKVCASISVRLSGTKLAISLPPPPTPPPPPPALLASMKQALHTYYIEES